MWDLHAKPEQYGITWTNAVGFDYWYMENVLITEAGTIEVFENISN